MSKLDTLLRVAAAALCCAAAAASFMKDGTPPPAVAFPERPATISMPHEPHENDAAGGDNGSSGTPRRTMLLIAPAGVTQAAVRARRGVRDPFKPGASRHRLLTSGPLVYPLLGSRKLSSTMGARLHPIHRDLAFHNGIDIPCADGTPVRAVLPGFVRNAGWAGGYGNFIDIDSGDGLHSRYGHLEFIDVTKGNYVLAGQFIGRSGHTGGVTGPHLHLEIIEHGIVLDPMKYF